MSQLDVLEVMPALPGEEPEEAPARRIQTVPLTVSTSGGLPNVVDKSGRPGLDFPHAIPILKTDVPVTAEMTAGEVANMWRQRCARCVHFRNELWTKTMDLWARSELPSKRRIALSDMIRQYAHDTTDHVPSTRDYQESALALRQFGVCVARTEEAKDLVLAHPLACCPEGSPNYYQDRTLVERKEASRAFDAIMNMAQGRKP